MQNIRTHYFRDENDTRTVVYTAMLPTGHYLAYLDPTHEPLAEGWGHSRLAAIADLQQVIEAQANAGE